MKKKHPEHVNLERWLVSYADFITLLFAFFVVMYATSMADIKKMKKVTKSIREAFGVSGMIDMGAQSGGHTANPFEQVEQPGGRLINLPAGRVNTAADPDPSLTEIRELLEEMVSLEMGATELSDELQMEFDSQGLIVRIAAKDFFDPGKADIHPDLLPLLDRIGRVVLGSKKLIRLEGHVDLSESSNDNAAGGAGWILSTRRAATVAQRWIHKLHFDPTRLGIAGYSYYRPLTRRPQPLEQAKNRRVEIIILKQKMKE